MICPICGENNLNTATVCRSCGPALIAPSTVSHAIPAGTKLQGGAFSIGRVLGQGGFGITYLGGDARLNRPVAIKEFFLQGCARQHISVHPTDAITLADYESAREGFLEEARRLAQFQHPFICQVFHSFQENNTAYMVMEYLRGTTLQDEVNRQGTLSESEAVTIINKIGEALEIVHRANLLHRDIKPDNIMLVEGGRPVLVDFGAAREFAAGKTKRMTATLTPGYAPMEQYGRHARFGAYTDIYALGATLYHLLTGIAPIEAPDRMMGVELDPPRKVNSNVSQSVSDAVLWAMEVKVDQRPQAVRDFLSALAGKPSTVTPVPTVPKPTPKPTPAPIPPHPTSRINPKDGAEMVFVPAGEFNMGDNKASESGRPPNMVYLDGYYIYKTPVTVAQYKKFCAEAGHSMPRPSRGWSDDHPIVYVSWNDASAYAKWAGVRLPNDAEWEKAARGTDGRKYPWGNNFDTSHLWCSKDTFGDAGSTTAVGMFPSGASPYGALDMAGNVWQWCADWYLEKVREEYKKNPPSRYPPVSLYSQQGVLRGGSWDIYDPDNFRSTHRLKSPNELQNDRVGFRCAADP